MSCNSIKHAITITSTMLIVILMSSYVVHSQDIHKNNETPSGIITSLLDILVKDATPDNLNKLKSRILIYQQADVKIPSDFDDKINSFANKISNKNIFVRYELINDIEICEGLHFCSYLMVFKEYICITDFYLTSHNTKWSIFSLNIDLNIESLSRDVIMNSIMQDPTDEMSACKNIAMTYSEMYKNRKYDKCAKLYVDNLYYPNRTAAEVQEVLEHDASRKEIGDVVSCKYIGEYNCGNTFKTCVVYLNNNITPCIISISFYYNGDKWKIVMLEQSNVLRRYSAQLLHRK